MEKEGILKNKKALFLKVSLILLVFVLFYNLSFLFDFSKDTRKCYKCGTFYPVFKQLLNKNLETFFKKAKVNNQVKKLLNFGYEIIGVLVPHAGMKYCGQVAADAYKQLLLDKHLKNRLAVILGPSHFFYFEGVAIPFYDFVKVPNGTLKVFNLPQLVNKKYFFIKKDADKKEHSLEVQYPFLVYLGMNKIFPLLIGQLNLKLADYLASVLASKLYKQNFLLVISSDFYHYKPHKFVIEKDSQALNLIKNRKIEKLFKEVRKGNLQLCGIDALLLGFKIMQQLFYDIKVVVIDNTDSSVVTGDKNNVVGYASVVFLGKRRKVNKKMFSLTNEDKKYLLALARKTIESYLKERIIPNVDEEVENLVKEGKLSKAVLEKAGAFVTLNKRKGKEKSLRGCIGYIMGFDKLYKVIQEAAINAAVNDPRFEPVKLDELPNIEIEISVLTPFQECTPSEIKVGRDGLYIKKGWHSGLLLPQVATEYNLSEKQFLEHVCLKAGLPPDAYLDKDAKLYKFQALVFSEE